MELATGSCLDWHIGKQAISKMNKCDIGDPPRAGKDPSLHSLLIRGKFQPAPSFTYILGRDALLLI